MQFYTSPHLSERLHIRAEKMHALASMLTALIEQGDPLKIYASGIYGLMDDQTREVAELAEWADDMAKQPAATSRLVIEEREHEALRRQSAKLDAELAGHDPHLSPEELREKIIADHARRGVAASAIAEALNMKEAAVAKVVAQLLGTDERAATTTRRNKAVNE